jgi:hypothetical protein
MEIRICDECNSDFYKEKSEMESLCPECSYILYDYLNCEHVFEENNRCKKCFWNGNTSDYINTLKDTNFEK